MNTRRLDWKRMLAALLVALICAAVFRAWLAPENVTAWLRMASGFCF
ncbi:hypothetical protein [Zestomonas carbonaria]|uniref:Uncharacterized protein n=1 Tax=Zestomonas carbonaria TaxID=2762745 RepID=A0A7U7I762_9GAMM|nr:hypothetical protein [Pseudomonas carbonaria]CAD5105954.1 hypothetical protein PSEWESI4_00213 [Pseudomonas carbonaria]